MVGNILTGRPHTVAAQDGEAFLMSEDTAPMPREFLLKLMENEIKAGFVFVEKARQAYKRQRAAEGDGALQQAVQTHKEILQQVSNSPVSKVRAITHQLTELREAIDWLRETVATRK